MTVAPEQPVTTPGFLGRAVYGFFLDYIKETDPDLSAQLHGGRGRKPFTCSTLVGGKWQDTDARLYTPEEPAWLRLTGLTPPVSAHLQRLAADPPPSLRLDGVPFQVQEATLDGAEHGAAGHTTYEELAAPTLLSGRKRLFRLKLEFVSPTTFRVRSPGGKSPSWPVPMPRWVFASLRRCWNDHSPLPVPDEDLEQFVAESVVLSRYRLRTRAVPLKKGIPETGCVGVVHYLLLKKEKYWARLLNLLAAYSFYAGVGYQTTVGLGQTKLVSN